MPSLNERKYVYSDVWFADDMENIELKVVGKRDSLNELQAEKCEVEGATNDGENEKNETNEEKTEEDDEYKKLPKYSPGVPVGKSSLYLFYISFIDDELCFIRMYRRCLLGENYVVDKTGFLCRACNRFCLTSEDVKTHCQSVIHFNNIIKIMKAQVCYFASLTVLSSPRM